MKSPGTDWEDSAKSPEVFNCKNGVKIQRMEADEENRDEKFGLKKIILENKKTNKNIKTKRDVWTVQLTGPQWLLQDGSEEQNKNIWRHKLGIL